jgi:uncharacterized protein
MGEEPAVGRGRALEALEVDECLRLLTSRYVGRLAYVQDGRPRILPYNYVLHEGLVVLRAGPSELVDGLPRPVAFEVDDVDMPNHQGWSVVVEGRAEEIVAAVELAAAEELPLRPWAPGERVHYVRIMAGSITGRRIR